MPPSPPTSTPLPTRVILDSAVTPALFRSYCRLYAAAWRWGYTRTAALDFEAEVAPLLGLSRTQARQHLRSLRLAGLVDWSSDGAHRYTFHFAHPDPENDGRPGAGAGKAEHQPAPESGCPDIQTLEEVKEEEILNLKASSKLESAGPDSSGDLLAAFPDSARILAATPALFGEPVLGPPSRYPDPRLLLAHIAAAYTDRGRLRHPARAAYTNLRKGLPPDPVYLADPAAWLPAGFLEQIGLAGAGEAAPIPDPGPDGADGPAAGPEEAPEPEPDPSLSLPVAPLGPSAGSAWQLAASQLEVEMPRAAYNQYLRPARLAGYDLPGNTFTVLAANAYARDWLQSRLASTLVRLLTGICNRSAAVRFTAPEPRGGAYHRRPPPEKP